MSFVRIGKGHGPPGMAKKKKIARKKAWDDTVHDLTAYKATPEEIAYRRASHKSKHAISTRLGKHPGSAHKVKRSPFRNNAQARKLAIMKEVLYDQQQLQNVLEKSDTMMAVVKDLFGDDPRRFAGFPNVTSAPNAEEEDASRSLASKPPPIQTRSEFLSDSMMDSSALNDLQDSDSEDEVAHAAVSYQPKMNMQRFQEFLEKEENINNNTFSTISGQAGMSHLGHGTFSRIMGGPAQSSQLPDLSQGDGKARTPTKKKDLDESLEILQPPGSAINDTKKVKKTRPRVTQPQPQHNTSGFSLTDLKKVLENLEDEVSEYERQTGRRPMADRNRQESFSGYTLAIVDSVTKLTRYLKECELRLQAEITVREQLSQDVIQFRALVDALTSDIITTQEDFGKMAAEFVKFKRETQEEIIRLKSGNTEPDVEGTEDPGTVTPPRSHQPPPSQPQQPHPQQQQQQQRYQPQNYLSGQDNEVPREFPRELNPFGDHLRPVPAAVMLSPPVRRSRVMEPERDISSNADRQSSLLDVKELVSQSGEESNSSNLLDDYRDLPQSCSMTLPSTQVTYTTQPLSAYDIAQRPAGAPPTEPHTSNRLPQSEPHVTVQTAGPHPRNVPVNKPPVPTQNKQSVPHPLNTVNVPRPIPLVQSNVNIPIGTSSNVNAKNEVTQSVPRSHDQSHDPLSLLPSSDRAFLANQIAELNKQHEEAQKRLESLMLQQKSKDTPENQLVSQPSVQQQEQTQQQQPQGNQTVTQQQNVELQQLQQLQQRQQQLQRNQQQKLLEMVQEQQQRILEQQQQQQRILVQQQQRPESTVEPHSRLPKPQPGLPRPIMPQTGPPQPIIPQTGLPQPRLPQTGVPQPRLPQTGVPQPRLPQTGVPQPRLPQTGLPQPRLPQTGLSQPRLPQTGVPQQRMPQPVISGQDVMRQSTDIPGYRPSQKQVGLPAYPISPNISPISQRSERVVYQSIDSQNGSMLAPASRGITVSIPKVDMDLSGESPPPMPVQLAR